MGKILILPIIAVFIAIVAFAPQDAHATGYTAVASGAWDSPITWGGPAPLVIGPGDTVTIPATMTVILPTPALVVNSGTITVDGTLVVAPGGILKSFGTIIVDPSGIINIIGTGDVKIQGSVTN